jgi:hypothetical protein
MNLSATGSSARVTLVASSEWSMEMGLDCKGNMHCYYAEVMRHQQRMCRLYLAREDISEEAARKVLTEKARAWIADFTSRPPASASTFDTLSENMSQRKPPSE